MVYFNINYIFTTKSMQIFIFIIQQKKDFEIFELIFELELLNIN
jgi:hypothetical protein